jgi:hypothetical protein
MWVLPKIVNVVKTCCYSDGYKVCAYSKAEFPLIVLNLANDFLFVSVFGSCLPTSMKFLV